MNSCIHCGSDIDADRLEFLIDFNKPLTCKNCSMEQPAAGYKDKVKVVKSKTDAQIRKSAERLEQIKEKNKLWGIMHFLIIARCSLFSLILGNILLFNRSLL